MTIFRPADTNSQLERANIIVKSHRNEKQLFHFSWLKLRYVVHARQIAAKKMMKGSQKKFRWFDFLELDVKHIFRSISSKKNVQNFNN
jgi:hypothetical protein